MPRNKPIMYNTSSSHHHDSEESYSFRSHVDFSITKQYSSRKVLTQQSSSNFYTSKDISQPNGSVPVGNLIDLWFFPLFIVYWHYWPLDCSVLERFIQFQSVVGTWKCNNFPSKIGTLTYVLNYLPSIKFRLINRKLREKHIFVPPIGTYYFIL